MVVTDVYVKNLAATERHVINSGGTSSSKTYSILQLLIAIALNDDGCLISVVSESLPHLKRGAMRDFFKILLAEGLYQEKYHNKTDKSYKLNNSTIEFFGADDGSKMRGARRDYLYINECNNVNYEIYEQLEVRTLKRIYLDFNPVSEFWCHTKVMAHLKHRFIKSTYKDALNVLDPRIVASIEARRDIDANWWKVYGEGELGTVEGLIFQNFTIVDTLPEAKLLAYGLDFGYTNDPTAVIALYMANNEVYLDELIYQTGLTNQAIRAAFNGCGGDVTTSTYADSSEPKSIDELYLTGWQGIRPVTKGADSIRNGIQVMLSQRINVTKRSVNLIKELRNYRWATDKNGVTISPERPIDYFNHAIDAARYACSMSLGENSRKNFVTIDIF